MFNKLREKLKSWTKKISEKTESKKEKPAEKAGKIGKKEKTREIPIPQKFNVGLQKFEPDLEKIKEVKNELEKEEKSKPGEVGFFRKIASKIQKVRISEKEFKVYSEELEMLLLENNVALEVAEEIISKLKEKILDTSFLRKEVEGQVKESLKDIIEDILVEPFDIAEKIREKISSNAGGSEPYVILFCGINGTGKTTSVAKIAERLKSKKFFIPIGTSIAKTNSSETVSDESGISDYVKAFGKFISIGDYFTINISCPNAFGGQPFTDAMRLDKLLEKVDKVPTKKPVFLKLSPDLSHEQVDRIIEVSKRHKVDGFVCTNLTSRRENQKIIDKLVSKEGGISGKVVEEQANDLVSYVYKKTKGRYVIIGLGGVFSVEDAYRKIKLGASLVQLITGMIFEGPQVISEINLGLVKLIKEDGFKNISQAIGVETTEN